MAESNLTFFPATRDRRAAIAAGFRFGHIGTHTSRTIMLEELTATFACGPHERQELRIMPLPSSKKTALGSKPFPRGG